MLSLLLPLAVFPLVAFTEPKPTPEQLQFFEAKVRPLLIANCHECHGPKKQQGGLRLDTADGLRAGGDLGPVVVAGKPAESTLVKAIRHEDLKMPPRRRLKPEEIAVLTVSAGAGTGPTWSASSAPIGWRSAGRRRLTNARSPSNTWSRRGQSSHQVSRRGRASAGCCC